MALRESVSHYQQAAMRDEAGRQHWYERSARELLFYQQVVPHVCVPAPRLYYGDADSRCIVLLLEDLREGTVGDALKGCSPDQADLVL